MVCAATRDQVEVCVLDVTREREQGRVCCYKEQGGSMRGTCISKAESVVTLGPDSGGRVSVASTLPFAVSGAPAPTPLASRSNT